MVYNVNTPIHTYIYQNITNKKTLNQRWLFLKSHLTKFVLWYIYRGLNKGVLDFKL